jgi:hypothetical protein
MGWKFNLKNLFSKTAITLVFKVKSLEMKSVKTLRISKFLSATQFINQHKWVLRLGVMNKSRSVHH